MFSEKHGCYDVDVQDDFITISLISPKKNVPDCQVLSDRFFHRGLYHLYPILDGSRTGNRISLSPLYFPCIFEAWTDKLWPNCSTKPRRGKFPYLKTVTDVFNEEKQQTQVDKGDSKKKRNHFIQTWKKSL